MPDNTKIPIKQEILNLNGVYVKKEAIVELISQQITKLKKKEQSYGDIGLKLDMNRGNVCLLHKQKWFPDRNNILPFQLCFQ